MADTGRPSRTFDRLQYSSRLHHLLERPTDRPGHLKLLARKTSLHWHPRTRKNDVRESLPYQRRVPLGSARLSGDVHPDRADACFRRFSITRRVSGDTVN